VYHFGLALYHFLSLWTADDGCGTVPLMTDAELQQALETATATVEYAQQVRKFHRRRTEKQSLQRRQDIDIALGRIKDAMVPLRSFLGRFSYRPQTQASHASYERVSAASQALQAERRKLWKMKQTKEAA
jgi:hypothetical protein